MEKEDRLIREIKTIYTTIMRKLIDPSFVFPEGGKVKITLQKFISEFSKKCGGSFNTARMVDYCVFQIHKNRTAKFQRQLASKCFGQTALSKYDELSSKSKVYMEDQWLLEAGITRTYLNSLISKKEHPQAKYIYMQSEECTKQRYVGTEIGLFLCSTSTLMWSPFSPTCQKCEKADECKLETAKKYPELYRIRIEKYGER